MRPRTTRVHLLLAGVAIGATSPVGAQSTAIRAGRLVDAEVGTVFRNQIVLIEEGRFSAIGPNVNIPTDGLKSRLDSALRVLFKTLAT